MSERASERASERVRERERERERERDDSSALRRKTIDQEVVDSIPIHGRN